MARNYRLLTLISSPSYLKKAWVSLNKTNKSSRGLSEETIEDFANSLDTNIIEISKKLKSKTYYFSDVRPVLIPKGEKNDFRPLRLAEISDRVVQKALAMKLEELLAEKYKLNNDCSFAYRKGGKVENAIKKMIEHYNNGYQIILEADIKKFFDNVNRKKLLQKIFRDLPDRTINKLIEAGLNQGIGNLSDFNSQHHHYFLDSIHGIPQGNSLSPLLANIYLSPFDQKMISEGLRLIRYADDFIIMCRTVEEAKNALVLAKEVIEKDLGLSLHELAKPIHSETSKTRIIDPKYHKFSFLSICFNGREVWINPKKLTDLREKINIVTDLNNYKKDPRFNGLITVLTRLKNLLEGWLSAFKYVDVERNFEEIDDHINYKLLTTFTVMGFNLKTVNIVDKKIKSVGKKVQLLNTKQRNNSGVPMCVDFLKSIERKKI